MVAFVIMSLLYYSSVGKRPSESSKALHNWIRCYLEKSTNSCFSCALKDSHTHRQNKDTAADFFRSTVDLSEPIDEAHPMNTIAEGGGKCNFVTITTTGTTARSRINFPSNGGVVWGTRCERVQRIPQSLQNLDKVFLMERCAQRLNKLCSCRWFCVKKHSIQVSQTNAPCLQNQFKKQLRHTTIHTDSKVITADVVPCIMLKGPKSIAVGNTKWGFFMPWC